MDQPSPDSAVSEQRPTKPPMTSRQKLEMIFLVAIVMPLMAFACDAYHAEILSVRQYVLQGGYNAIGIMIAMFFIEAIRRLRRQ